MNAGGALPGNGPAPALWRVLLLPLAAVLLAGAVVAALLLR